MKPIRTIRLPSTTETQSRLAAALGASLIVHATALTVFALLIRHVPEAASDVVFETAWEGSETPWFVSAPPHIAAASNGIGTAAPQSALEAVGLSVTMDAPRLNGGGSGTAPGPLLSASALAKSVGNPGGGIGRGHGGGIGDGEGPGHGTGGFFGLNQPGKKIVYVVDCSRSMNHPYPGRARTRLGRVKLELLDSIRGLHENQQFFIIFFNDRAYPMPAEQLVDANNATKLRFLEWMARAQADGHTDPRTALLLALQLQPDLVYFLTDGDFRAGVVKDVAAANRGRVAIHTIGFGDNTGEPLLKAIAEQNRGVYQFIPEEAQPPAADNAAAVSAVTTR